MQTFVTLDADRRITGVYPPEVFPTPPDGAVALDVETCSAWLLDQTQVLDSKMKLKAGPLPTPTQEAYQAAIQNFVDQTAASKEFNDGVTLASYVNSTVPTWAAQAGAFVAWRDQVWSYTYAELAKVQAGDRAQPTVAAFLEELPTIEWPAP